jgi:hypothetical protein
MVNKVISYCTDKNTFLNWVYIWTENHEHTWFYNIYVSRDLRDKPLEGNYSVKTATLGLDAIEIPVFFYDGKKYQEGVIKIDIAPDKEDVRVNFTWEKIFTHLATLLIIDISKVFREKQFAPEPWRESKAGDRERDKKIWELRNENNTWEYIAEEADCGETTVKDVYKRLKDRVIQRPTKSA